MAADIFGGGESAAGVALRLTEHDEHLGKEQQDQRDRRTQRDRHAHRNHLQEDKHNMDSNTMLFRHHI